MAQPAENSAYQLVDTYEISDQYRKLQNLLQIVYDYQHQQIINDVVYVIEHAVCDEPNINPQCKVEVVKKSWKSDALMLAPPTKIQRPQTQNQEVNKFIIMYANFVVLIKMMGGNMVRADGLFPGYSFLQISPLNPLQYCNDHRHNNDKYNNKFSNRLNKLSSIFLSIMYLV